jgi:hypothetical protein
MQRWRGCCHLIVSKWIVAREQCSLKAQTRRSLAVGRDAFRKNSAAAFHRLRTTTDLSAFRHPASLALQYLSPITHLNKTTVPHTLDRHPLSRPALVKETASSHTKCRNISPLRHFLRLPPLTQTALFCDYCDVYLTHDSMSVRKAHNAGRNHLRNVVEYYQRQ